MNSKYTLSVVLCCMSFLVNAATPKEREYLKLTVGDIEQLILDVKKVQSDFAHQSGGRGVVNYDAIVEDLTLIKNGIKRRIEKESTLPVNMEPIKGSY